MLAFAEKMEINDMRMSCNKLLLKYFMSAQDETEKIQRIHDFIEGAHYYWFCSNLKYLNNNNNNPYDYDKKVRFMQNFIEFCHELIVDDVFTLFCVSSFK